RLVGDVGRWDVLHRVGGLAVPFSDQPVEVGAEVPPVLVGVAGGVGDGAAVARRRLVVVGPAAVQAGGEEQADVFGTDLVDGCGHAMMLQVVAEPVAGEHVGGDRVVAAVGGFEGERPRVEQGPQGCRWGCPGGRQGGSPRAVECSARAERRACTWRAGGRSGWRLRVRAPTGGAGAAGVPIGFSGGPPWEDSSRRRALGSGGDPMVYP